jgi:hypothetical protein
MKKVSDILYVPAPLSFIQIKLNKYECICPWCATGLDKVKATTYGELASKLFEITANHMDTCINREMNKMQVTI